MPRADTSLWGVPLPQRQEQDVAPGGSRSSQWEALSYRLYPSGSRVPAGSGQCGRRLHRTREAGSPQAVGRMPPLQNARSASDPSRKRSRRRDLGYRGRTRGAAVTSRADFESARQQPGHASKLTARQQAQRTPAAALVVLNPEAPADRGVKMAEWQECMEFAVQVARKAGAVVCAALKEDVSVMVKSSPADLVTATDQKVEEMIISSIKEKYPSHSFIGEESVAAGQGSILTDNPTWIIDPIDGTTNFVHRFPFVAVSIGFAVNKQVEFGVVYSCVEDKMYTGRRGNGAYCNGQKLQISGQKDITKSMIITELGSNRDPDVMKIILSNMERLLCIPIHGIRAVGTAAVDMCLVATGGADAYYEMGIHCWDVAASSVIVTEAGGLVLDANGGPFDLMSRRVIAASSKEIGERIAKELQIISLERDDGKKE